MHSRKLSGFTFAAIVVLLSLVLYCAVPGFVLVQNARAASPRITSVDPASAKQGTTLDVAIVGTDTNFADGVSVAGFGMGITVNSTTVSDPLNAIANITVAPGADVGTRDVNVITDTETPAPLAAGFTVELSQFTLTPTVTGLGGTISPDTPQVVDHGAS